MSCPASDSQLGPDEFNTQVRHKGQLIPAVGNSKTKTLTYTRDGYKVRVDATGAVQYKSVRTPKPPGETRSVDAGHYTRTVDSNGWTVGVKPRAVEVRVGTSSTGKPTYRDSYADGVDRSKVGKGSAYYTEADRGL